jgi:xanthine dehydrogenase YagT iron-sulfur-binding subunit
MADDDSRPPKGAGVSRRDFLKISGITATVPVLVGPRVVRAAGADVPVYGPGKTPIVLTVNGKRLTAELEPRVTLLDALRDTFDLTGTKRVCDRAECGACSVLLDGKLAYSCSVLAIDAQGQRITTVEGLTQGDRLSPLQQAFIDNDAQQCGFCTPGFIVAGKVLLDRNPHPSPGEVEKGLSGNFCRCGTYAGMRAVFGPSAGERKGS